MARKLSFSPATPGCRLDQAVSGAMEGLSRRQARALIAAGAVFLDGRRCHQGGRRLTATSRVVVHLDPPAALGAAPAAPAPALAPAPVDGAPGARGPVGAVAAGGAVAVGARGPVWTVTAEVGGSGGAGSGVRGLGGGQGVTDPGFGSGPGGVGVAAAPGLPPILFEDADLLVVNKPAGLHVNETETNAAPSLMALLGPELHLVHRLDRQTSGLLVLAKHPKAARELSARFAARQVKKRYFAAVTRPVQAQTVEAPIGPDRRRPRARAIREGGKSACTVLSPIQTRPGLGLIDARPHTGRTHQIRLHLAHLGAPIFGDLLYGGVAATRVDGEIVRAARVMLHAASLCIQGWPGLSEFHCPWPDDFEALFGPTPSPDPDPQG